MLREAADGPRLGERLRRIRRHRFVGRAAERAAFRRSLAAPRQSAPVMFVHGPGGIGKSALLDEMAGMAEDTGVAPLRVDAAAVGASRDALMQAVDGAPPDEQLVMLIDNYELLSSLDEWMRERFLAGLPENALVVIAGRRPPGSAWLADPAWRELVAVLPLTNLAPAEQQDYLIAEGVSPQCHERLRALSHGHPLALSLLVDRLRRGEHTRSAVPRRLTDVPDVLRALLARIVEPPPTARHTRALQICAHARYTTETLLDAVMGGTDGDVLSVARLFQWLRTLPFMVECPFGLHPTDIARDVLDADLQWRNTDDHGELHRRVRAYVIGQVRADGPGPNLHHRVADAIFVARVHPEVGELVRPGRGGGSTQPLRLADRAALVELAAGQQGAAQADLVEHWMDRQPAAFRVLRDGNGTPAGFAALLALDEATEADLDADPGARAMWNYAIAHGRPRAGESVLAWRFLVDGVVDGAAEAHLAPADLLALLAAWRIEEGMARPAVSWDFVGVLDDATWEPLMRYLDFGRAAAADYTVGGRHHAVFGHDWRRVGLVEWLHLTQARELGLPAAPPHCHVSDQTLAESEFAAAVRDALRNLHEPLALRGNALLDSRLVRERAERDQDPVDVLRGVLADAAERLRSDPRRESDHRALDLTFLHPAPTQEQAAKALDMSFSTYRRRRDRAVQRIVDLLWQGEIGGGV